jgi:hypothetical protein
MRLNDSGPDFDMAILTDVLALEGFSADPISASMAAALWGSSPSIYFRKEILISWRKKIMNYISHVSSSSFPW